MSQKHVGCPPPSFPIRVFLNLPEGMADSTVTLPIIDIDVFRASGPGALVECDKVSPAVATYPAVICLMTPVRSGSHSDHHVRCPYRAGLSGTGGG